MKTLNVDTGMRDIYIEEAMEIAKQTAAFEMDAFPEELVIVSWFDCRENKHSPSLISGWDDYGRSHGATLRVELNGGEFVFFCEKAHFH